MSSTLPMGDQLYYVYCILLRLKKEKEKKKERIYSPSIHIPLCKF